MFVFMPSNWLISFWSNELCNSSLSTLTTQWNWKPHSICQALLLQEIYLWWGASYGNILAVYPTLKPRCEELRHWWLIYYTLLILGRNRDTLYWVWWQDTLLLKGTKHQLSVYDKMPIVNGFSKTCVTFQFSFWSITEARFEK